MAHYFGTSAELWMTMQAKYDLETAEDRTGREIKKRVKPRRAA
jgi:plasmid maintenance system antidote protein VapI